MRAGWEIRRLGDFFDITSSKRVLQAEWRSAGIPFYRAREVVKLAKYGFVENELFISNEMYAAYKAKYGVPSVDDILITGVGTLGVCYLIKDTSPFYFKDGNVIWLHKRCNILSRYVIYAFQTEDVKKQVHKNPGATVGTYTIEGAKNTIIPVPSLPEQQRIVVILDQEFAKIDALKANAEKSLQAAKDLFQATLKKELEPKEGWKRYCLRDVCTDYGDYGMSLPSKSFDGVRYLRITDITEWGDLNDDKVSVDADEIDERYMVRAGDILFARTGATVGKTLVYEDKFGRCCYAGYLIRYRPDQSIILPRMLYYITHSASYYDWVAISQKSATLPNISAKLYNSYELSLPSTKEQDQIISRLDDLNEKCIVLQQNYQKTLVLCDDLKQAILRKAFNGEL